MSKLDLLARAVMFVVLCAVSIYLTHFILPGELDTLIPDIAINLWARIGLFIALTLGGIWVAFWITLGDVVR